MKFTALVAADLYGQKVNLELTFGSFPSVAELERQVETTFSIESSALRPPGQGFLHFRVDRMNIFDEQLGTWVDLLTASQLHEYAQIYAFPREAIGAEAQGPIPTARLPTATTRQNTSPARSLNGSVAPQPRTTSPPRSHVSTPSAAHTPQTGLAHSTLGRTSLGHTPGATPNRYGASAVQATPGSTALAAQGATRFPDNPTHETKLRAVFDTMDAQKTRAIVLDEFRQALQAVAIEFSPASTSDLFAKADADKDGVISFHEFQLFAQHYPALVDALYFRMRERHEERRKREALQQQQARVEEQNQKERQAQEARDAANADLARQEQALQLQEQDLQQKLLRERDARQAKDAAKQAAEQQQRARGQKEGTVASGKEKERQRHLGVVDAQRGVQGAEGRVGDREGELSKAQEKERQLEALLAEARRDTERQLNALRNATDDLTKMREAEQRALEDYAQSQREVQGAQDELSDADRELGRAIEDERQADGTLKDAQRDAANAAKRRDEEERELALQRERDGHHTQLLEEQRGAIDEQARAHQILADDLAAYLARRAELESQEQPLLDQELRLREQRFNLEQREGLLRAEVGNYNAASGRSPIPGSPGY